MDIVNIGSMNIDYVYQVDHFVQPGETLGVLSRTVKAGGKGLNQSIALARAGAAVSHAGCIGIGGEFLKKVLDDNRINTEMLFPVQEAQGHTVIQVDRNGENCILLCGGSNRCISEDHVRKVIQRFSQGDWMILQNEVSRLPLIVNLAAERGMHIVLNPSPFDSSLEGIDYSKVEWLLVNETEAKQISGENEPIKVWEKLHEKYPEMSLLITQGREGSTAFFIHDGETEVRHEKAIRVNAVDTTAAGDTYTGYFVAGLAEGRTLRDCMKRASRAAAIAVTRAGAAESIPWRDELD